MEPQPGDHFMVDRDVNNTPYIPQARQIKTERSKRRVGVDGERGLIEAREARDEFVITRPDHVET